VNDRDAGLNGASEIVVVGAGSAMQGEEQVGSLLDRGDAVDVEALLRLSSDHAAQHAVRGADGRREEIATGFGGELGGGFWRGEGRSDLRGVLVNLRTRSDVADFAFDEDFGADRLGGFDSAAGCSGVLVEGKLGGVEDNEVESGAGSFFCLFE